MAGANGSIYGIPCKARNVLKFDPIDKTIAHIGPDLHLGNGNGNGNGNQGGWSKGAMTDSGIIYCPPVNANCGILKIDTKSDAVTELDRNRIPDRGDYKWLSCATALDGCIYFMPCNGGRILKLDPNNGDAMSIVGDDLGDGPFKYMGTVAGIDGCVYGIPYYSNRIVKYDPINDITSFVADGEGKMFMRCGNGALGRNGCIYALAEGSRVLKIDTTNNSYCFVGNSPIYDFDDFNWGDAILGIDGCIYWPPLNARYALKYDPHTDQTSLVGEDFGSEKYKWDSGALTLDGVIYSIPKKANRVLSIDPLGAFSLTTKITMEEHPEELGLFFQTTEVESSENSKTNFDHAVVKFGQNKVFEVLDKFMKPVNDLCKESNLYPFMIVASYKESAVCAINHSLRNDLSWVYNFNFTSSAEEGNVQHNHKQRHEVGS